MPTKKKKVIAPTKVRKTIVEEPVIEEIKKEPVKEITYYGNPKNFRKVVKEREVEINERNYTEVKLIDGTTELCSPAEYKEKTFKV